MHELNLLPSHRRRSLRHQATLISLRHFFDSLLLGAGLLTIVGFVMWTLLLFFATTASEGSANELLQEMQRYQQLRDEIAEQNSFLGEIHTTSTKRLVWSVWLQQFLERIPQGVDIAQIAGHREATAENGERVTATVSGRAASSRTLDTFTRELHALPQVASVDAPLSNLLNPGAYSLTLILTTDGQAE